MTPKHLKINTTLELNNGIEMPQFGLGVYLSKEGDEVKHAISAALDGGYRLIDTAKFYDNEVSVGAAVRGHEVPREEIFVTTKLWNSDHGYDNTLKAYEESFKRLDLGYMDLFLVHYPVEGIRKETWKAMERIYEEGSCKAIGISNYMAHHMEEMFKYINVMPALNQIELHPYCYQHRKATIDLCEKHNIAVQAYSPLVRMQRDDDAKLMAIAEKYNKTNVQILVRWSMQNGFSVIPKSSNPGRIHANADVFDFHLQDADMKTINNFDEELLICWDPMVTP